MGSNVLNEERDYEETNGCGSALQPKDEPLQLIEFVRVEGTAGTTIQLVADTIDRVFKAIGELPISIICVCGPSRQGKSFLLGYMIRCLEGMEKDEEDWFGWEDKKKPLEGFKFRNGTSPETQGIWVWSKPFIVKDEEGKDLAVLLVDTQGTYDEFTTNKDMSAIVGLSLLTSSMLIFNFFTNLQEDTLLALNTYIQYGSLALDKGMSGGTPFQKLNFLIRDWNNPGQFPFGAKGGKQFLDEKLKIKEGQAAEAKHIRETIRKCFQDVDCFLMPSIGDKALYPEFKGSIDELAPKFAAELEKLINSFISCENLAKKEILGSQVTAPELRAYLESYVEIFNSEEVPSADTMWQATEQISNNNLVEKSLKKYQGVIKKKLRGNNYLQEEDLERGHSAGKKQAFDHFKKAKKFGSPESIAEFAEKLEDKITKSFSEIKKQNQEKRKKFIAGATTDAADAFRSQLEDEFPFEADDNPDCSDFYEQSKMKRFREQAKAAVLQEFEDKVSKESEDRLVALVQSVEEIFESIFSTLLNKNDANRANAEKTMDAIVEKLLLEHRSKLQEYLESNKYQDDEAPIQDQHAQEKLATVGIFQQEKKPGNKEFHKEYIAKLESEMDSTFTNLKNEHQLHIGEVLLSAEKSMKQFCDDYENELREAAEGGDLNDEFGLKYIHSSRESSILEKFNQDANPFPRDSKKSEELETKLKELLTQVCDRIKSDVLERQRRSLESYKKAAEHAVNYYKREMKDILEADDFLADDDLEMKHHRIQQEALEEYERFEKIGIPDEALEIKQDMNESISEEWERTRKESKTNRELAISNAKNYMTKCKDDYEKLMKPEMETARTVLELNQRHADVLNAVVDQLNKSCPVRQPTLLTGYEEELRELIAETYEELKDVFEMRRSEEETTTKGVLIEAKEEYNSEMKKHCSNHLFMHPGQLETIHVQVKETVLAKCEKIMAPLSRNQMTVLGEELDNLLDIYIKKNDMNLNSGDMGIAPAIGIDLGTTYCCVAVFYKGKVHIIPNQEQGGNLTTPSYVAFNLDGSETYGEPAKDNAYKNPENTIYDAKRIIGRKITDEKLQNDMLFWPFTVQQHEGVPKVMVNGELLYPEQISGKLLAQFRVMADKFLKLEQGTIRKAVITVPAYFNDGQRQATVDAGELAGFEEVLTILNEPTAAAIAYSLERHDMDAKKILIYDLGGGTFDVAVLEMKPKQIDVLAVNGDTHLGGEDFDKKLMEYCASQFQTNWGIDLFKGKDSKAKQERDDARRRLRRLQTYCEKAKRELASGRTTKISVDAIIDGLDLTVDVTRDKFEELNMQYFEKSIKLVEETLKDIGLQKEEIDDVVLVGGSSRIPKVQEMLTSYFGGKALNSSIHPDYAVAYGAAVKAALMNGEQAKGQIDLTQIKDVTPMSLGIEIVTKELSVILPKNTKLPARMKKDYYTVYDNQTSINIKIYQGEDFQIAANNKKLGEFVLNGIPSKPSGKEPVDIWMEINSMGILHVEAICRSTEGRNSITVQENKQRMSRETIRQLVAAEAEPA